MPAQTHAASAGSVIAIPGGCCPSQWISSSYLQKCVLSLLISDLSPFHITRKTTKYKNPTQTHPGRLDFIAVDVSFCSAVRLMDIYQLSRVTQRELSNNLKE